MKIMITSKLVVGYQSEEGKDLFCVAPKKEF